MAQRASSPSAARRVRSHVVLRVRAGLARVRAGILQALQLTVAAVAAFVFSQQVFGHHSPIFAATAATVALGFAKGGLRYRRVLEVGIGCTLGIAFAELLIHWIGTGILQAGLIMLLSVLLARFLDSGILFTTQMALQSLLVVMLPPTSDGPFGRSLDAVVGGAFALLMVYLFPADPRRAPRDHLRRLTDELSRTLHESATALREEDAQAAWHSLIRARRTQPEIDAVATSLVASREITRAAPAHRRHRAEVMEIGHGIRYLDLATRNTRVLARRVASAISHVTLSEQAVDSISRMLDDLADAVVTVGNGLAVAQPQSRGSYLRQARSELAAVARDLDPREMGADTLEAQAIVLLMRPMTVDLIEATGATHEEALTHLPHLEDWDRG